MVLSLEMRGWTYLRPDNRHFRVLDARKATHSLSSVECCVAQPH